MRHEQEPQCHPHHQPQRHDHHCPEPAPRLGAFRRALGKVLKSLALQVVRDGGDVADNFRRLYDYMDDRLMESNVRKTDTGLLDVLRRLGILRDAWAEMLSRRGEGLEAKAAGGAFASHA